jgi:hypothetical protein
MTQTSTFVDLPPRLRSVLYTVGGTQEYGVTWRDLARMMSLHHGQASGALSSLHRRGFVARLKEKRDGCSVYVTNRFVNDRDTVAYGRGHSDEDCTKPECQAVLAMYESVMMENRELRAQVADLTR